jgi:hypothetical protein
MSSTVTGGSSAAASSCAECGAAGASFGCSRCHRVRYCGAACQRGNWKAHKTACAAAATASGSGGAPVGAGKRVQVTLAPMRALPTSRDAKVCFHGGGAGLPTLCGTYMAKQVAEAIELFAGAKQSGRTDASVVGRVHANLTAVPVEVAFRQQGDVWANLLDDLRVWHVARYVFEDVPLPWLTEEEETARRAATIGSA